MQLISVAIPRAIAVATTFTAATVQAQTSAVQRIVADVRYLADDAREGRGVGTAGLDSAAAYLARRFSEVGLAPAGTDGYLQPFEIDSTAPAAVHAGLGGAHVKNIVGLLPGRGPLTPQAVVIGAHYDHLGFGGMGSRDPDSTGVVHNGADDNASGAAALLETAHILSHKRGQSYRTLVFVAFTAEELGLIGSEHYATHPARPTELTRAMINFDMVGRLRHDSLLVFGSGSARELPALLDSLNADRGLTLRLTGDPWGRSDHSSFYARKIPVVHFFSNLHSDYHRTTDDWDKINAEGIERVAQLAADLAWTLAIREEQLAFVNVPRPAQTAGSGYGAYLGTIPDMSESPGGVRLTGVRAGSPAEQAGLQGGDILVQLGEFEIKNLYDMTDALRAHKAGDVVQLVVTRGGERIEMTATLGKRGG